jgi:hypothetical protein
MRPTWGPWGLTRSATRSGVVRAALPGWAAGFVAALLVLLVAPVPTASARADCGIESSAAPMHAIAPVALAADLPQPFGYHPADLDQAAVSREVADVVKRQAEDVGADPCFQQKAQAVAQRIAFLSPFEFLVMSYYEQDPVRRDTLLDRYATDPQGAIAEVAQIAPMPRAQMLMATYAYYSVESDRVLVNVAQVPPSELRRVLVHESWHAMPRTRTWTDVGGVGTRVSGFWTQERRAATRVWVPTEDRDELPFEPYLLNEAMATLMETRYAGPSRFVQKDVEEVRVFLEHLMAVSGPEDVMRTYLDSQPDGFVAVVDAHRNSLPELEALARP